MPQLISTNVMIQRLVGMLGTKDLNDWEAGFVASLKRHADNGQVTKLTEKQVERLDELHSKHFA